MTNYGHYTVPFTGSAVNIITFPVLYIVSGKYYAVSGKYYAVSGKHYAVSGKFIPELLSGIPYPVFCDVLSGEKFSISQKFCQYPPPSPVSDHVEMSPSVSPSHTQVLYVHLLCLDVAMG